MLDLKSYQLINKKSTFFFLKKDGMFNFKNK